MSQAQHPEELLAEYVDGTIEPEDRARVESHLAACVTCREEIDLGGSARQALGTLAELEVPVGTTWPVVQRARQRKRWLPSLPPRVAWAAGAAAAVAAAVIVGSVFMGGPQPASEMAAPGTEAETAPADEGAAESPAEGDRTAAATAYPTFRRSSRDYDAASLTDLARDLTVQAKSALEQGFPEPPARFYTKTALLSSERRTQRALSCVAEAVSPSRSLAPFTVVAARFDGEAAYIGAFLQADRPDRPYAEVALYVVSRDGCALRSFARQRL